MLTSQTFAAQHHPPLRRAHRAGRSVRPGEKVGIIGDNGAGKSTLLRLIAGVDRPDNGDVTVVAPGGVGFLAQSLALPPQASVQDAIDLSLADLRELESLIKHADVLLAPLAPEVYSYQRRVLGLTPEQITQALDRLSAILDR